MNLTRKKQVLLGAFLLLLISIPTTIFLTRQKQEDRSRASASTTLAIQPQNSAKHVGDTIPLDIQLTPGNNLVTFVRFQVQYDASKVELDQANPFTLNTTAFPTKVEGPVVANGSIAESISVGSDPTKAIQKPTKIGTLNFKAIAPTDGTATVVTFGNITQALSSAATDQAGENVISSVSPAQITIDAGATTGTPSPSGSITPSAGATTTPQPTPNSTLVTFTLLLHGVGSAGDNPNPAGNSLSNKSPLHPQRNLDVEIYNSNNNLISSASGAVVYDAASGTFIGKLDLGPTFQTSNYAIKIKSDRYLRRLIPGIQKIENLKDNALPVTELVAGDVNGDNILNVLDYNALLDCGFGALNPLPMADQNSLYNTPPCQVHAPTVNVDINDNGIINSVDYNLFLRELSVQNGD